MPAGNVLVARNWMHILSHLTAILSFMTCASLAGSEHPFAQDDLQREVDHWRTVKRCGINATYVLLKLLDCPVSYQNVSDSLETRESGQNLRDMRNYIREKGYSAEIVHITPSELLYCPLPAIALVESDAVGANHFVVLLTVSSDWLDVVDGTTGAIERLSFAEFFQGWHGYILVSTVPSGWATSVMLATAAAVILGVILNINRISSAFLRTGL